MHMQHLVLLALAVGCGEKDPVDTAPEGDTDADSDADSDTDVDEGFIGRLRVEERYDQLLDTHSGLLARVGPLDSPWEADIDGPWAFGCWDGEGDRGLFRLAAAEGECELYLLEGCGGRCEGGCPVDTYCLGGEACVPEPRDGDAGTITLSGLSEAFEFLYRTDLTYPGYSYLWDPPADLYAPGDTITFSAPGAALPAFEVSVTGPEALDATLPCDEVPSPGADLTLTWTPSGEAGARVRWEMLQDVHLMQGPRIRCETDDDGSFTVPASLLAQYLQSERQNLTLTRYVREQIELQPGRTLQFEAAASVGCIINPDHWW
ncbi:MAG: hypothetical protein ABIO70_31020 [Pseudomonadota bacterium]